MINVKNKLMSAWYNALNGVISVPVYRTDADPTDEGNYVLLRFESETEDSNNANFVTLPVIITEVVTKFSTRIDDGLAADIDTEIGQAIFIRPGVTALGQIEGIQISDIRRSNATEIQEDDGTNRYLRLITRNIHRVVQNNENS